MTLVRIPLSRSLLAGALVAVSPVLGVVAAGLAGAALGIPVTSGASYLVFVVAFVGAIGLAIVVAGCLEDGA
jgi:hypothetical protein